MHVSGAWLTNEATQAVTRMLSQEGYEIFFVGGCIRNALLGVDVSDIDMATNATPEQVIQTSKAAGLKSIPTGIDHGTITVISGGIAHEITTYRTDVATDGRHAQVAFSDNIRDDALRRDFTMNALYADATGEVFDPVDGLPDLNARRVRFVGAPDQRIREDYLRILRFFRFHAWYGDPASGIDPDGLAACAADPQGLANLSRERVGAEMIKLLSAPDPAPAIAAMAASGVLQMVMSGADPKALAPLVHFEAGCIDWRRRAVVLGGLDLADHWRLSKKDAAHLTKLRDAVGSMEPPSTLAYHHGSDLARNAVFARAAIFETPHDPSFEAQITAGVNATFPIKATDLQDLSGSHLGQRLRELETAWVKSTFTLSKEALLTL